MQQFPRTELYLQILRQELAGLEVMGGKLPTELTPGEIHRSSVVSDSIREVEYLLQMAQGGGWSRWQGWFLLGVSFLSMLSAGIGIWALLSG